MDKAFLIHFDREVELLQDLTSSRQKLESSLDSLETPQRNGNGGGRPVTVPDLTAAVAEPCSTMPSGLPPVML